MNDSGPDVRVFADQVYSHAGGAERLADVYIPFVANSPVPVVIWIHGGGWRFGDRHLAPDLNQFAQRSGLAVISIDYRLSDEAKFPAPVEDVKTAVRWARSVASDFDFNQNQMGLWGSSAGAHLAACAALSQEAEFCSGEHPGYSSRVQAVVDGYGPTNFAWIDRDRSKMQTPMSDAESLLVGAVVPTADPESFESRLIGTPVGISPQAVELANPVHYVQPGGPPFLILHGEADSLIPCAQSRHLFDALSAVGIDATLALFQNLKHGFFNSRNLDHEEYGAVTVNRSSASTAHTVWSCDSNEKIVSMVSNFFRAHLLSQKPS